MISREAQKGSINLNWLAVALLFLIFVLPAVSEEIAQEPQQVDPNTPQKIIRGYKVDTSRKDEEGHFVRTPVYEDVSNEVQNAYAVHRSKGAIVDRTLEKIDVTMYMSEREVAILAFPTLAGEFDYLGFSSTDEKVLDWCKDLHSYYWERGSLRDKYYINSRD